MRNKFILLFIGIVALLSACSSTPPPQEGYVLERRYQAAHWEGGFERVYAGQSCGMTYDSLNDRMVYDCSPSYTTRWNPQHTWYNDSWRLRLELCEENDKGEEKCRSGWRNVTEEEYASVTIGDYYPKAGLR